jgi:hypothetical protein
MASGTALYCPIICEHRKADENNRQDGIDDPYNNLWDDFQRKEHLSLG